MFRQTQAIAEEISERNDLRAVLKMTSSIFLRHSKWSRI